MFDIITVGSATKDIFLTGKAFKAINLDKKISFIGQAQCFPLGGKIEIDGICAKTGGGATNAAFTFKRQGLKTATLVKTGKDEAGEHILQELKKEKIFVLALKDNKKETSQSVILSSSLGERTILTYRGASEDFNVTEIPFNKLNSQWAFISSGHISPAVLAKIFSYFSKNKTLIALNLSQYYIEMGVKKLEPFLKQSKVVILNCEEAAVFTGISYEKEKEIFAKFDKLIDGIAIMTKGNKGISMSDGKNIYKAGIFQGKIVDRTGAGDAFGSGFISGLIQKNNLKSEVIKYAIRLGMANATSVVGKIGAKTGVLTKKEFINNKRWQKLSIQVQNVK